MSQTLSFIFSPLPIVSTNSELGKATESLLKIPEISSSDLHANNGRNPV